MEKDREKEMEKDRERVRVRAKWEQRRGIKKDRLICLCGSV